MMKMMKYLFTCKQMTNKALTLLIYCFANLNNDQKSNDVIFD